MPEPLERDPRYERRFWSKVAVADGCWLWKDSLASRRYGTMAYRGRRLQSAHRLAWAMVHGRVPAGVQVLHRCDTGACVRPSHLFLGSSSDNMRDMHDKGRWSRTDAKLTADDARAIRRALARGVHGSALATAYSVSYRLIARIADRSRWRRA